MIALEETSAGLILPVKAHPGARKNAITGIHDGALRVAVSQAPEKGKANAAIVKVLADALGLKKNQIELLAGPTSGQKKFLVRDIAASELLAKISVILGDPTNDRENVMS